MTPTKMQARAIFSLLCELFLITMEIGKTKEKNSHLVITFIMLACVRHELHLYNKRSITSTKIILQKINLQTNVTQCDISNLLFDYFLTIIYRSTKITSTSKYSLKLLPINPSSSWRNSIRQSL